MKKIIVYSVFLLLGSITLSSCATVLGGPISSCQRTKPAPGRPTRAVRPVALIADIVIFWPFAVVDFATGAIYKPCK
ncbi:hypothetical protein V7S79_09595 [Aquirufa sp. ROCK-SH2]